MEPVEIDIQMKQNITEESKKAVDGITDINSATDKTNAAMGSIVNSGKQAIAAAKSAVQEQVNVVKQIEADIKNIESQLGKAAPGNAKSSMIEELNAAKQALSEEKAALGEYSVKVDEAANANVRLRTQVMNAKQTLDEMAQAGLRGTDVYKAQQTVLGDLQMRMNAANKQAHVLGDPQGGMHAAMQTATGLSGAFTAATGVMSLFAGKNEDLQRIQMRLQAVMAITIGLTQTAEMLNKNSYFTLKILVPAKEMLAAAELKVAGAMGISTVSAQILMGTLTLGLTAAISGAIYVFNKLSDASAENAKKMNLANDLRKEANKDASAEMSKIKTLQAVVEGETASYEEKSKAIKKLKDIVPGYIAQLDSTGRLIRENTKAIDDYVVSLNKKAMAEAAQKELEKLFNQQLDIDLEKQKLQTERNKLVVVRDTRTERAGQISPGMIQKTEADIAASNIVSIDEKIKKLDDQKKELQTTVSSVNKIISDNASGLFMDDKTPKAKKDKVAKEQYDAAEALQKLLLDINDKTSSLLIKQQEDGLQKRLDEIDHEKEEEVRKITEKETAIIEAYNKNHRTDKGFKPLSTKPEDLQNSLTSLDPKDTKYINQAMIDLDKSYQAKRIEATEQWGQKMLDLAGELADKRVKIEDDWNKKINQIDTQAQFLDSKASTEVNPALKKKYEDEAAYLRAGEEADKTERDKRVSEVTLSYIKETETYKLATDQQLNLGKKLNDELVNQIKERVKAEVAAGKLTQQDANKILDLINKSQAKKVSGSLGDLIDYNAKLQKAKDDLAKAQKNGDADGVIQATEDVNNYTKAVETNFQKLQKGFEQASFYANQAVGLLNAISTKDGDAASSAAKSIGAVMTIADATMQGYEKGGYVGAGIALITSSLTQVFNSEKAHQQALAAIAKAKLDTQKEYNDLLMKQNELLKAAESIFGTDTYAQANAYAAQISSYNKAKNDAVSALSSASVQTGSHKTGLFGWGGEKADYSNLLGEYPKLIDAQGNLNTELAQSILDNQKLDDTSKAALQSALDYTSEYETALTNLQSYLSTIFGSLGNDLMTSIVANLNDSKAAIDEFKDYVGDAIKTMIADIAKSIFFTDQLDALQTKIKGIYTSTTLTAAQKQADIEATMSSFVNDLDVSGAQKFINDAYSAWESATGKSLTSTRTGTTAALATASQDSINELSGGVYALRTSVADIRNFAKEQLLIEQTMSSQLKQLIDNTSYCKLLDNINKKFDDLVLKGIKIYT